MSSQEAGEVSDMKEMMVLRFIGYLYRELLRDLIVKAVDDPDSEVDDIVLLILDRLLPET